MATFKFVIHGNPYVKKSNMKLMRRGRHMVRIPTQRYQEWADLARLQIRRQTRPDKPIDYPVNLLCKFYKRTHGVVDLSALYEGIQDELVKEGVLLDDNFKIVASHDGSGVEVDPENPRMIIVIQSKTERPGDDMWPEQTNANADTE